jgi:hypothetical protein
MKPFERLTAIIIGHQNVAYKLGASDCTTFAAAAFESWTGRPFPVQPMVGKYKDAKGAARMLAKMKAADVGEVVARHLEEIPPAFATTGDLITHRDASGQIALGVCVGELFAARGEFGLVHVHMTRALRAFRSV